MVTSSIMSSFLDKFFPMFLLVCCVNWSKGTFCCLWFLWQPTHSDWTLDHLSVYFLTLQWGNVCFFNYYVCVFAYFKSEFFRVVWKCINKTIEASSSSLYITKYTGEQLSAQNTVGDKSREWELNSRSLIRIPLGSSNCRSPAMPCPRPCVHSMGVKTCVRGQNGWELRRQLDWKGLCESVPLIIHRNFRVLFRAHEITSEVRKQSWADSARVTPVNETAVQSRISWPLVRLPDEARKYRWSWGTSIHPWDGFQSRGYQTN